jgi:hypothetical protein
MYVIQGSVVTLLFRMYNHVASHLLMNLMNGEYKTIVMMLCIKENSLFFTYLTIRKMKITFKSSGCYTLFLMSIILCENSLLT